MNGFEIGQLIIPFGVILFSLVIHESAHAWSAAFLGDATAQRLGRISLNPSRHIDPIGTVLLPIVAIWSGAPIIGWAKPVPVNPANLKHPRRDFLYIAAAGPMSNLVLAVFAAIILSVYPAGSHGPDTYLTGSGTTQVFLLASAMFDINVLLAVFNMIPIPPLDGGNVLAGLLPETAARVFDNLIRPWGFVLLYLLLLTGVLGNMIMPVYGFFGELLLR